MSSERSDVEQDFQAAMSDSEQSEASGSSKKWTRIVKKGANHTTLVTPDLSEAEETMPQQLGDDLMAAEDEQEEAIVATRVRKVLPVDTRKVSQILATVAGQGPRKTVLNS